MSGCLILESSSSEAIYPIKRLGMQTVVRGGGTYSTVKYAVEQGLEVEYIK